MREMRGSAGHSESNNPDRKWRGGDIKEATEEQFLELWEVSCQLAGAWHREGVLASKLSVQTLRSPEIKIRKAARRSSWHYRTGLLKLRRKMTSNLNSMTHPTTNQ